MVTLILASRQDSASLNLHEAVMRLGGWGNSKDESHGTYWIHESESVHLLLIDELHIHADGIDIQHEKNTGFEVEGILVLSRHVSASNTPALTLHAIGLPGETPHGEPGQAGGIKGQVVPPHPLFAALFRRMVVNAKNAGLDADFDLTLETTHHGPILSKPTLYIEIGSTENEWMRIDAANCWAKTLSECLSLNTAEDGKASQQNKSSKSPPPSNQVMIGFGGGHYAPRHRDVILRSDVSIGHLVANYALEFIQADEEGVRPRGAWSHSVKVVVESTRIAFPDAVIFAHLDRKSFKGWQRRALVEELTELGLEIRRGKEVIGQE